MHAKVYLVGAGPGDPGLITVRGRACIEAADVVVYDYLAPVELLAAARPEAERIYVGKKGGDHTLSQEGINALLVEKALAGKTVARLKGGDPFVFGRGGEEVEALIAHGIAFEVVPGVTSAVAAPAYAGIPLTHRDYCSTVSFVTGHEAPDKPGSAIDWQALAQGGGTLVFFMGVKNLPLIVERLRAHGMPGDRPVALVRWGTTPWQVTVSGTLDAIVEEARQAGIGPPALIVVGGVVELRRRMQWFDNRPLFGRRIVVTRAREQASDLRERLNALGAGCLECPTIRVAALTDTSALDEALDHLARYRWLVFTSVNGVRFFFDRLFARGQDVRALGHLSTAVIGPATAARLRGFGLRSDILPASYRAEAVAAAFRDRSMQGTRVLLPRAAEARPVLPQELRAMGARVDEITVYATRLDDSRAGDLRGHLAAGRVDMVTFTSSSTVRNFKRLLDPAALEACRTGVEVACIGPVTAATAREEGFEVDVEAGTYTIAGLVEAIAAHYRQAGKTPDQA